MIAQCLRGHSADPQTRFLVPARNDAVVAYVITIIYRKARLPNEAVLHVYLAHRAFYLTKPRFVFYLVSLARILPSEASFTFYLAGSACVLPRKASFAYYLAPPLAL